MSNPELKQLSDFLGVEIPSLTGPQGEQGIQGEQGHQGERGDKGNDGKNGKDGESGKNGKDGKAGEDGKNGNDGRDGKDGQDANEEKIIETVLEKIPKPKDGKDGKSIAGGGGYSWLQRKFDLRVYTQTAATRNHFATTGWEVILCNATSNAITVNLPSAVGNQARLTIKKTDSSANAVTIDGLGSQTIDGSLTSVISVQNVSITIVSNQSNWFVV